MRMTEGYAVETWATYNNDQLSRGPCDTHWERTIGLSLEPLGMPDVEKRDPDLEKDLHRLVSFAQKLSRDRNAEFINPNAACD